MATLTASSGVNAVYAPGPESDALKIANSLQDKA